MKTTYQMLLEAKTAAMKSIFATIGGGFEKLSSILSEEELMKSFDFFSGHCAETDDAESDIGLWLDYLEFAERDFSKLSEARRFLKNWN